jgi:hypothetical protein
MNDPEANDPEANDPEVYDFDAYNPEGNEVYLRDMANENCIDLADMSRVAVDQLLIALASDDLIIAFGPNGETKVVKGVLARDAAAIGAEGRPTATSGVRVAETAHAYIIATAIDIIEKEEMTPAVCQKFLELLAAKGRPPVTLRAPL